MDFIQVLTALIDWFSLRGGGYSFKLANGVMDNILVDKTCICCHSDVILIAELTTSEDPVEVQLFNFFPIFAWCRC